MGGGQNEGNYGIEVIAKPTGLYQIQKLKNLIFYIFLFIFFIYLFIFLFIFFFANIGDILCPVWLAVCLVCVCLLGADLFIF